GYSSDRMGRRHFRSAPDRHHGVSCRRELPHEAQFARRAMTDTPTPTTPDFTLPEGLPEGPWIIHYASGHATGHIKGPHGDWVAPVDQKYTSATASIPAMAAKIKELTERNSILEWSVKNNDKRIKAQAEEIERLRLLVSNADDEHDDQCHEMDRL